MNESLSATIYTENAKYQSRDGEQMVPSPSRKDADLNTQVENYNEIVSWLSSGGMQ